MLHVGFVLEGFDLQPSCESQREMIRTITQLLPEEKLRVIHGLCKPGILAGGKCMYCLLE